MSTPTGSDGARSGEPAAGIAAAIAEVSDRANTLVREEIELAKAEVTQKVSRLARGAIIGAAAGVFILMALFFVLVGLAWLLYYYLPIGSTYTYFWGFFAMALILLVLGALAGLLAARALKRGAPTPDMAIEEARRIRETVASGAHGDGEAAPAAATSASFAAPAPYGAAAAAATSAGDERKGED